MKSHGHIINILRVEYDAMVLGATEEHLHDIAQLLVHGRLLNTRAHYALTRALEKQATGDRSLQTSMLSGSLLSQNHVGETTLREIQRAVASELDRPSPAGDLETLRNRLLSMRDEIDSCVRTIRSILREPQEISMRFPMNRT